MIALYIGASYVALIAMAGWKGALLVLLHLAAMGAATMLLPKRKGSP